MIMISLDRIHYFIAVAESGSFTRAAQVCFVSQTAISQQIATLEKELGVRLFLRDKKSAQLTAAGIRLLPMAKRVFDYYCDMLAEMHNVYQNEQRIVVGYVGNLEMQILREAIFLARQRLPGLRIEARKYPLEGLAEAFVQGQCSIALIITDEIDAQEGFVSPLITGRMMVAVSERNALASRESVRLGEILHLPLILFNATAGPKCSAFSYHWVREKGFPDDAITQANTIEDQQLLVAADQGISFLPEGVQAPGIVLIPLSDTPTVYSISAYYHQKSPQIKQCIALMQKIAQEKRSTW